MHKTTPFLTPLGAFIIAGTDGSEPPKLIGRDPLDDIEVDPERVDEIEAMINAQLG